MIKIKSLNIKLNSTFNFFYKFRFKKDYLKNNLNKKKYSKINAKKWYDKHSEFLKIFSIKKSKLNIGLIIYNIKSSSYSIVILKKYRSNGYGTIA